MPTARGRLLLFELLDESRRGSVCVWPWMEAIFYPDSYRVIHPTLLSCSPHIPWAEPPPRLITAGQDTIPVSFCFCSTEILFLRPLKQWLPQPRPCWRECNADLRWASDDSGEGTDAQCHMPEWCPQTSFSFFSPIETELASAHTQSSISNFSCHFSQEELINIP